MKHTVLALLLVMAVSLGEAAAQNIALGERVPEIKHTVWLDGHRAEKVAPRLRSLLSPHVAVALDQGGRGFAAFGVSYLPFGVLVNARKRTLWMGNSLQMNKQLFHQITNQ